MFIDNALFALVRKGMSVKGNLINLRGQLFCNGEELLTVFFSAKNVKTQIHQPSRLDIMPVGMQIDDRPVVFVKEDLLSVSLGIIDLLRKGIHNPHQAAFHSLILRNLIKLRVRLEDMEQGVHGLCRHHAVFGELFVGLRLEIIGKRLEIADRIRTLLLDQMKECERRPQRFLVSARLIIRGQRIDTERLIIGVLRRILRRTVRL